MWVSSTLRKLSLKNTHTHTLSSECVPKWSDLRKMASMPATVHELSKTILTEHETL